MVKRFAVVIVALLFVATSAMAAPKGAKAIFDSGEGPAVGASVASPKPSQPVAQAPKAEKYVGISYQLMLVKDDGSIQAVTKSRTFRSGERVKMLVRTNRPGYMTILNIGPTGNTNVLFNEWIEAATFTEIPKGTVMKFAGAAGTEKLLIMLSDNPNPMGGPAPATTASAPAAAPAAPAASAPSQTPPPAATASSEPLPPPPPATMVASNMEGGKSVKKGSKDIVMDSMDSSYAVINPRDGYKAKRSGGKDMVLESQGGTNYGVVPVSAVSGGGILTLQVNLKHR
jgi:biotin carboxyl carrier protein